MLSLIRRFCALSLLFCAAVWAQGPDLNYLNHNRPVRDSHNCYPNDGRWADRIDRALQTGFPVAIEEDLAWYVNPANGRGRVVVSHSAQTHGTEPTLRAYFFERVRPMIEKALRDNNRSQWPLIILHFDFKDNQAPLLHAVWQLLGEYEAWITTAPQTADSHQLAPFNAKPLLVLTEESDAQEEVFSRQVPVGSSLRLFGSAHNKPITAKNDQERHHLQATLPPEELLSERPTNYRRWWNNSWYVVEEGGASRAGDWTPADMARLRSVVDRAHNLGFWIRFYTLDGFAPADDRGWGKDYNFGSLDAVRLRWKAALDAGVNLIATDQYEELAAFARQNESK
jgi:hypothetical protein